MPFDGATRSPADLIEHAISMLSKRDAWCQSTLGDDRGRHCAVGALIAVTFGDGDQAYLSQFAIMASMPQKFRHRLARIEQIAMFAEALGYLNRASQRRGFDHIMRLNDNQLWFLKRTQHKFVLATMRDAAKDARNDQVVWTPPPEPAALAPMDEVLVS